MSSPRDRVSCSALVLLACVAAIAFPGCPSRLSPDEQVDKGLKAIGKTRETVYPLSGKVTIDGQPPALPNGARLVLELTDPQKLDQPSSTKPQTQASPAGDFEFGTYKKGDGVKPGKYIVTFAVLQSKGKRGLIGPDQLKNLYNDPEKNAEAFTIDHVSPGKTDYDFKLQISGKEAAQPGPHALTDLSESMR